MMITRLKKIETNVGQMGGKMKFLKTNENISKRLQHSGCGPSMLWGQGSSGPPGLAPRLRNDLTKGLCGCPEGSGCSTLCKSRLNQERPSKYVSQEIFLFACETVPEVSHLYPFLYKCCLAQPHVLVAEDWSSGPRRSPWVTEIRYKRSRRQVTGNLEDDVKWLGWRYFYWPVAVGWLPVSAWRQIRIQVEYSVSRPGGSPHTDVLRFLPAVQAAT